MKYKPKALFALSLSIALAATLLTGCRSGRNPNSPSPAGSNFPLQEKKLAVIASFYPMYDFAVKIGGDKASVADLVPAGTEPHDWEPTASDIASLEQADVFVYSGAGMEQWADTVINALENKDLVTVEASKGITLRKARDTDSGDAGNGYDPHVWLAPLNAKQEMENIKNALAQADPDNAGYYEDNYKTWGAECDKLDQAYRDALSGLAQKDLVVSHEAFGYLCDAYGLHQMGIEGLSPDSEPDPARMAEIQDFVKANNVKVIFSEELVSPKVAQAVADATGAEVKLLNPLEGLSDEQLAAGGDYFSVMRQNLDALKTALQ